MPYSNAGGQKDEGALVQHLCVGSWKGYHPFEINDGDGEDTKDLDEKVLKSAITAGMPEETGDVEESA